MQKDEQNPNEMKVHLSLGSNIGDREGYLRAAINRLKSLPNTELAAASDLYLCDPVGDDVDGYFLNMVVCIITKMGIEELHKNLVEIEKELGKKKENGNGNRTIDIDVIFADDLKGEHDGLVIPHPLYSQRDFVLLPLMDISHTLEPARVSDVRRHLDREKGDDRPRCIRYKSMVY